MKQSLSSWQLLGYVFTSIIGTVLHFAYEWSLANPIVALFSGVNESTWEHMKLLFFPMLIFAIIEYLFVGKDRQNYWCIKAMGISLGLLIIPIIFYTYLGTFGHSVDWFNISIFFIAAGLTYYFEMKLFAANKPPYKSKFIPMIILLTYTILFFYFTFASPSIPLFQDPITQLFGISKKS